MGRSWMMFRTELNAIGMSVVLLREVSKSTLNSVTELHWMTRNTSRTPGVCIHLCMINRVTSTHLILFSSFCMIRISSIERNTFSLLEKLHFLTSLCHLLLRYRNSLYLLKPGPRVRPPISAYLSVQGNRARRIGSWRPIRGDKTRQEPDKSFVAAAKAA